MSLHEDITIMKTEIKEEIYDFEMPVDNVQFVNVKEEYICSDQNNLEESLEVIKSGEQLLNENLVSGNCQLIEEDPQKKQKSSKKRLHLKRNKAESKTCSKRRILVKQGGELKKYKCAHCKYATHSKHNLERHIRIHTNDRPFKCTYKDCKCTTEQEESCNCSMCGYAAAQKDHLKVHILIKHSGETKKYKCTDCSYASHQKQSLNQHILRLHFNDRPFKCTYKNCECRAGQEEACKCSMCGYAAIEANNLKAHILLKHSAEPKKYKCAHCKYATHQKQTLKRHIRIHTNDRPFKCTYKNCKCIAGQEESCECNMCGYATHVEYFLKKHILLKHSGKLKEFKCAFCKYATHKKSDLDRHIRTHTKERPFKCIYKNCNCTSGQETSCKCDMCEYATAQKFSLRRHVLRKHSGNQGNAILPTGSKA